MESCNPGVRSGSTKCSVAPLSTSMVTLSPPDQKIPAGRAVDAMNAPKIPPGVPLIFWDSFVGADPTCAGGVAGAAGFPADSAVGAAVVVAAACAPAKEVPIAQYENPKVIGSGSGSGCGFCATSALPMLGNCPACGFMFRRAKLAASWLSSFCLSSFCL